MNRLAAILGIVTVGAGLSLCDLCDTDRLSDGGTAPALVSVADARTPAGSGYLARQNTSTVSVLPASATKTVAFKVKGMTCGGCVLGVRKVLTRLPGVSKADVSYEKSRAVVTYDSDKVTPAKMIAAIKTLGYSATIEAAPSAR